MDQRAASLMPDLAASLGAERVYYAAGWPLSAWLPLAAVSWLRRHEPGTLDQVRRLCFVDDWIKHRLCGEFVADPSSASITGLFDVKENQWQPGFLQFIGFTPDQLSPVAPHAQPIARLTPQAAETLGLPQTTWVVNGAHDQICGLTAVGAVRPGQVMLGTGAAWVVAGVADRPLYDLARGMCLEPHSIPGLWSPLRSQGAVGACVEWLVTTLLAGLRPGGSREELYASLDRQAAASPLGASGLLFLPPRGRRNEGADGGLVGLSLSHAPGDVGRALMEGVAYDLCVVLAEMRAAGLAMDTLIMTGGATRSPLWPAIVADVLGVPVYIPEIAQAGARGAAILAGVGAGLYPDIPAALVAFNMPNRQILPDQQHHGEYNSLVARYRYFDDVMNSRPT
jgi:xylulokinase